MKNLLILLFPILVNCQILTIDVDVVFSNEVRNKINLKKLCKKLNETYFEDHGIDISMRYVGEINVKSQKKEGVRYVPETSQYKNILFLIVPEKYMSYIDSVHTAKGWEKIKSKPFGYSVEISGDSFVIDENNVNVHLIAHELCHVLSLSHVGYFNNLLMGDHSYSLYKDKIKYKIPKYQVEKIRKNILLRNSFKNVKEYMSHIKKDAYKRKTHPVQL